MPVSHSGIESPSKPAPRRQAITESEALDRANHSRTWKKAVAQDLPSQGYETSCSDRNVQKCEPNLRLLGDVCSSMIPRCRPIVTA
jgi:hypothetical protein